MLLNQLPSYCNNLLSDSLHLNRTNALSCVFYSQKSLTSAVMLQQKGTSQRERMRNLKKNHGAFQFEAPIKPKIT